MHSFSDASDVGYGQCSYLRLVNTEGNVHCVFVFGKSRVVPLKPKITIPRLELVAAVLSSKIASSILKEIEYRINYKVYWCDSEAT